MHLFRPALAWRFFCGHFMTRAWYNLAMLTRHFKTILIAALIFLGLGVSYYFQSHNYRVSVKGVSTDLSGKLIIDFLDVGQGDAELIRTPEGADILIDGGPDDSVLGKLGEFLPFYDRDLELVILSHPHADHVSGLNEILKRYEVKKILMTGALHTAPDYLDFLTLVKEKKIPVQIAVAPEVINFDSGISLQIIYPDKDLTGVKFDNLNNSSIVTKLIYASTSALFMGDLEIEEELLNKNLDLKSDVYKTSHHGSVNGNDKKFLAAVRPIWAVIEVGANNIYGLPGYRVIRDLERLGAKILRTDRDGDIELYSDGRQFYESK